MLTETELRIQLAAAYRLIAHFGMAELVYNHISVRLPGDQSHFLINPFGLMYREISASNLLKIDLAGNIIDPGILGKKARVNPAGFIIHSAIHQAREDAHCILHTHTLAGMAIASSKKGLIPFTQESLRFYHKVAYHNFQGIVLDLEEKQSLLRSLGDKPVLILKNHGLLTLGPTVAQAFCLMYYLEKACQVQLAVNLAKVDFPSRDICEKTVKQHWGKVEQLDEILWPALVRMLDEKDPSYRQ